MAKTRKTTAPAPTFPKEFRVSDLEFLLGVARGMKNNNLPSIIAFQLLHLRSGQPLPGSTPETKTNPFGLEDPIAILELSTRGLRVLQGLGIKTVRELTEKTRDELFVVKNCGRATLCEMEYRLRQRGLFLRSETAIKQRLPQPVLSGAGI